MKVTAGFHRISLEFRRHRQAETINPNDLQEASTRTEKKKKSWKFAVNTLCWNTWHHHATKTHHLFIPANCMIFLKLHRHFFLQTAIYSKLFLFAAARKIQNTHLNSIIRSQKCARFSREEVKCPSLLSIREQKKSQHVKFHFLDAHWIRTMFSRAITRRCCVFSDELEAKKTY